MIEKDRDEIQELLLMHRSYLRNFHLFHKHLQNCNDCMSCCVCFHSMNARTRELMLMKMMLEMNIGKHWTTLPSLLTLNFHYCHIGNLMNSTMSVTRTLSYRMLVLLVMETNAVAFDLIAVAVATLTDVEGVVPSFSTKDLVTFESKSLMLNYYSHWKLLL